ncbi:MAG: hypothetical protein HYT64_02795 [Candidatus Yanofskybacteria bacterium]|nr:hypothetical protein [Candidatus Yanofskybacteria bacterium]
MRRLRRKLFWIIVLAPAALVANLLITTVMAYLVLVFDIYINTEKLSEVDGSLNAICQNIAKNSNFTKGPVIFRVDKGTLVFRLNPLINSGGLSGYSPFFIFPHHRTVIFNEETLKLNSSTFSVIIAHELGHIQGGLKHFGSTKEMEKYANDFAAKIMKTQSQQEPQK